MPLLIMLHREAYLFLSTYIHIVQFTDGDAGLSGFPDEGELVDFMTSDTPDAMEHYGGVVFINDFPGDNFPEKIYYKIRLRALHLSQERDGITLSFGGASKWLTDYLMPVNAQHGPREERDPDGGEPCKYRVDEVY